MPSQRDLTARWYPESRFGGLTAIDGTVGFYTRVHALLDPSKRVLDVGCGRGRYDDDPVELRRELRILKGRAAHVLGIDVDTSASTNPYLDEFRPIEGERWPVDDASVDLVVTDYVLEHIDDPEVFFAELSRVLRPGGVVCARTANKWGYVAMVARLVPNKWHARSLARAQEARRSIDVFPTRYRCNTRRSLRSLLERHGFDDHHVATVTSEPSYLSFSGLAYALGVAHQRFAPRALGVGIELFARKAGGHSAPSP